MELVNGMPPGLRGYMGAQEADQQSQAREAQQFQSLMQLKQQMDAQKSQAMVKDILANSTDMQTAIPQLMKAGPAGLQAASTLATLNEHVQKTRTAADKQAFYSPENQRKYMQPGAVTPPATAVDDNGNPNPSVQGQGQMDMGKFLQDAAARGVINPEVYANHIAQREQAKAALAQAADLKREQIQKDYDLAKQRSEDRALSQAEQNRARMDMIRLTAALKPAPQERMLPVQMPDGSVQYVPQSQAAGQNVGKVAPPQNNGKQVQQLGQVLERAKVNEANAVLANVEKEIQGNPKFLEYVSGPKAVIPDMVVAKMEGGQDILRGRQAVEKLFNITLKDRSGAAVTIPEYQRLRAEFGKGAFKTPEQMATAVTQARTILQAHTRSVAAGFSPDVLDAYNANLSAIGGSPILGSTASAAPAAAPAQAAGGWGIKRK